jgi:predicted PurR-regulated permease PerM
MKQAEHLLLRRVILVVMLGALTVAAVAVLHPFIVPAAWGAILAYTTWPLYRRLLTLLGGRSNVAALLLTLILAAAFVLPLLGLVLLLQSELRDAFDALTQLAQKGLPALPPELRALPVVGDLLQRMHESLSREPAAITNLIARLAEQRGEDIRTVLGGLARNAAKFALALITVFFLYRSGDALLDQTRRVLHRAIGPRVAHYLHAVGATTRAVVFGLVLTALAQGSLAGLGYAVAGVEGPVLLGALTALLALLPFGAPLVWVPAGVWLLMNGQVVAGVGLLAWGALVVSWIDNLIRPLVISNATDIPFLLVMFGVLGGLAAFGLVGIFVGPVVLAVVLAVWREWLEEEV